jgi:chromosome condensin MukBEF MukE localization factor
MTVNFLRSDRVQPGIMPQLLRLAPNLRCVELCSDLVAVADSKKLMELVEQRACLHHLERLKIILLTEKANN